MTPETGRAAIQAVGDAVSEGLRKKDVAAVAAQYQPDAMIFDLAPPLAHAFDPQGLAAWLDTWEGPVDQQTRDETILVSGDLAVCYGLTKVSARTKAGGEQAEWWQRITVCLQKIDGAWKIVHEHSSVPFHMDGSFRAAVDLQP